MIELTAEQKAVLEKIKVAYGGHPLMLRVKNLSPAEVAERANFKLCIMETIGVLQGHGVTDHPPCVSKVITSAMMDWNDSTSNAVRQQLADPAFIAHIIHSAPTRTVRNRMIADYRNEEYQVVEQKREDLLASFSEKTVAQKKELIIQAADLRRWEPEGAACGVPQPIECGGRADPDYE